MGIYSISSLQIGTSLLGGRLKNTKWTKPHTGGKSHKAQEVQKIQRLARPSQGNKSNKQFHQRVDCLVVFPATCSGSSCDAALVSHSLSEG